MLMTDDKWVDIIHFSKKESWGDWRKMDERIFIYLDAMREYAGVPFIVHCGYELAGHTINSQHYLGNAIDGHFENMPLIDQYVIAERFPWSGIGVYPDWRSVGLHLDTRLIENNMGSRWACKNNDIGDPEYCNLDSDLFEYIIYNGV